MLALVALAALLVVDSPPTAGEPGADSAIRREYEAVRSASGRSAADQVRLAYWCEAHGLTAERWQHLGRAVLIDPTNAEARALLGLVGRDGRWLRPQAVAEHEASDPERAKLLADYNQRRSTAPYTADGQLALGIWADDHGLPEQARAHFTASVRLDPTRDAAWRRLGYRKIDGRWQTEAQVAADRAEAEAQKQADKHWRPLLERWRGWLDKPAHRAEAEANLATVSDPRAVASIAHVFGGESQHVRAARLLGQIDSAEASRSLAMLAVGSPSAEARRVATETLRSRDAREYADLLIALIGDRIKYQVVPVAGPGSAGVLQIEGTKANVKRVYAPPVPQLPPGRLIDDPNYGLIVQRDLGMLWTTPVSALSTLNQFRQSAANQRQDIKAQLTSLMAQQTSPQQRATVGHQVGQALDKAYFGGDQQTLMEWSNSNNPFRASTVFSFGYEQRAIYSVNQIRQEALRAAASAQGQLENDKAILDRFNAEVDQTNDRAVGVLRVATGLNLPPERGLWDKWWVDLIGYRFNQASTDGRPTLVEQVPLNDLPQVRPVDFQISLVNYGRMSCFGAGTLVQTSTGPRAIETLSVGDLVLTQSTTTGALHYQPILRTHHNPPGTTFRVRVGGEEIVSSDFHRFWVAARGWVMARNLQVGDPIRTLVGVVPVEAIAPGVVEPVFNLDVADDADFFAGRTAALVHDNTLPDTHLVPFDRVAAANPR